VSEFEFMRALPFGPYIPEGSSLRRIDPRTRILLFIFWMAALLITRQLAGLILGLAVLLLVWWAAKVPFEPLRRSWMAALPFLLILALIRVFFGGGPDDVIVFSWNRFVISMADIEAGLALLLRFSAFITLIGLTAASLSESELTLGLQSLLGPLTRLGIPAHDFILTVQVTLRFFPLLAQTAERIAKAQASRGADWRPAGWNLLQRVRQTAPIFVPLFVSSLRRAESMALAMDARGYGSLPVRTSLISLKFTRRDGLILAVGTILAIGMAFPY
jgi:energy-coupling factor transport system permease protein